MTKQPGESYDTTGALENVNQIEGAAEHPGGENELVGKVAYERVTDSMQRAQECQPNTPEAQEKRRMLTAQTLTEIVGLQSDLNMMLTNREAAATFEQSWVAVNDALVRRYQEALNRSGERLAPKDPPQARRAQFAALAMDPITQVYNSMEIVEQPRYNRDGTRVPITEQQIEALNKISEVAAEPYYWLSEKCTELSAQAVSALMEEYKSKGEAIDLVMVNKIMDRVGSIIEMGQAHRILAEATDKMKGDLMAHWSGRIKYDTAKAPDEDAKTYSVHGLNAPVR